MLLREPKSERAFELFAEWEERHRLGSSLPLDEFCREEMDLLPEVRAIAALLEPAESTVVGSTAPQTRTDHEPFERSRHIPEGWAEIGRGASSVVYIGHDPNFDTVVAYKVLATDSSPGDYESLTPLYQCFELEAKILARLKHEGIVRIFGTSICNRRPVLVMEYLPGGNLHEQASGLRGLGTHAIAQFFAKIADAVGFAHEHGVVHRDLKPSNILIDKFGRPCVSDFGVAKLISEFSSVSGSAVESGSTGSAMDSATDFGLQPGTRSYMAPEQLDASFGPVTQRTDIWAFGVMLYEVLTGTRPFVGESWSEIRQAVCQKPVPKPSIALDRIGRRLLKVALKCLEKRPDDRFACCDDLKKAITAAVASPRTCWLCAAGIVASLGLATWFSPVLSSTPSDPKTAIVNGIHDQLLRGQPVTLIDQQQPPRYAQWATGAGSGRFVDSDDCPLRIEGMNTFGTMLELLPSLPPGSYRIEATLRQSKSHARVSRVGVYVAASTMQESGNIGHQCIMLHFSDSAKNDTNRDRPYCFNERLVIWLGGQLLTTPSTHSVQDIFHARNLSREPSDTGWRDLTLTVDAKAVGFNDSHGELAAITAGEYRNELEHRSPGHVSGEIPRAAANLLGGIGLYTEMARLDVRTVRIIPILNRQP
jgi:serine/threonine protein kinase